MEQRMKNTVNEGRTMRQTFIVLCLMTLSPVPFRVAEAQPPKSYRIGVIMPGGPFYEVVSGLKNGLKELGLEEGKQFTLVIQDTKGDTTLAGDAARNLRSEEHTSELQSLRHLVCRLLL